MRISRHRPVRRGGFTLLELVLAMLVMALLVGMIFSTSSANLELSTTVVRRQNEESEKNAFFNLLSRWLGSLPGNARMELVSEDNGTQYLSDLTLQNVPLSFNWGGAEQIAKAVQLSTVRRRDGFLDIVLRYFEEEILEDRENVQANLDVKPFAEIVLLDGVRLFEWRVLDGRTMDPNLYDWDLVGRLPLQMELMIAFGNDGEIMRQVFWITPKQDPAVMMRQLMQQQGAPQGGPQGDPPAGGDGDIEVITEQPGRPGRPGGRPGGGRPPQNPGDAGAPTREQ